MNAAARTVIKAIAERIQRARAEGGLVKAELGRSARARAPPTRAATPTRGTTAAAKGVTGQDVRVEAAGPKAEALIFIKAVAALVVCLTQHFRLVCECTAPATTAAGGGSRSRRASTTLGWR